MSREREREIFKIFWIFNFIYSERKSRKKRKK